MIFFILIQILIEHSVSKQWRSLASDLVMHFLSMSHKKDARFKWVEVIIVDKPCICKCLCHSSLPNIFSCADILMHFFLFYM